MICTNTHCPVHDPATAARIAREQAEHPAPVAVPAVEDETEEERQAREEENQRQQQSYAAEEERRRVERQEAFERQQKEYETETKRREKVYKARVATLEKIIEHAPALFRADQLRLVLEILLNDAPYGLFEEAVEFFTPEDENHGKTDDELLIDAFRLCVDEKLGAVTLDPEYGYYAFGYDDAWKRKGIELGPFAMPITSSEAAFEFRSLPEATFHRLPALLADALPDAFGNALIDAWMARKGISKGNVTMLDQGRPSADPRIENVQRHRLWFDSSRPKG